MLRYLHRVLVDATEHGSGQHRPRIAFGGDPAVVQEHDAVGPGGGQAEVVQYGDHRVAPVRAGAGDSEDQFLVAQVEGGGGLVQQERVKAFAGFYTAGTAMDPLKAVLSQTAQGNQSAQSNQTTQGNQTPAGTPAPSSPTTPGAPTTTLPDTTTAQAADKKSTSSTLPLVLGIAAFIAIGSGAALIIRRRRANRQS